MNEISATTKKNIKNRTFVLSHAAEKQWCEHAFILCSALDACNNQLQHCTKPIITYLLNDLNIWRIEKKRHEKRKKKSATATQQRKESSGIKIHWRKGKISVRTEKTSKKIQNTK